MISRSIRQHISRLEKSQPFTTKEFLIYGTRTAVDQTLCRLVKDGFIVRLARGVFAKDCCKKYSDLEIYTARVKSSVMEAIAEIETQQFLAQDERSSDQSLTACVSKYKRLTDNIQILINHALPSKVPEVRSSPVVAQQTSTEPSRCL